MRSPTRTHGGKYYLASDIVALMPEHKRYLEAFAGGLSVLFAKPYEGVVEFVNDLNGELTNFWDVLTRPTAFGQLQRMAEATPLSEAVFEDIDAIEDKLYRHDFGPDATRAYKFLVRNRMSRQGLGRDYCTPTVRPRRGMNENVSAWLSTIDGLADVHARLRRVEVWRRPAIEAIKMLDGEDLLVYADPPYVFSTRKTKGEYGMHEMTDAQHVELLDCLSQMKGKFILSGYANKMYDSAANLHGWRRVDFDLPNNASSKKTKERKIECVWMNY